MKREQVYQLIDAERSYQNRKWKDVSRTQSDTETPVAAWLIYIETHLELAKDEIYCLDEKVVDHPCYTRYHRNSNCIITFWR